MEESPSVYNTWQHGHLQTYKSVSDPAKNTVSYIPVSIYLQLTNLTQPTLSYTNNLSPWHQQVIDASITSRSDYIYIYKKIRFEKGHTVDIGRIIHVVPCSMGYNQATAPHLRCCTSVTTSSPGRILSQLS